MMDFKKFRCDSIEGLDFSRSRYNRKVGEVFDCYGVSYNGDIGIIFNPKSKRLELWYMKGMKEVQQ